MALLIEEKAYHLNFDFTPSSLKASIWTSSLDIIAQEQAPLIDVDTAPNTITPIRTIVSTIEIILDKLASSASLALIGSIGGTISTYHLYHLTSPLPKTMNNHDQPLFSQHEVLFPCPIDISTLDGEIAKIQQHLPYTHPYKHADLQPAWPVAALAQHFCITDDVHRYVTLGWILSSVLTGEEGAIIPQELEMATAGLFRQDTWDDELLKAALGEDGVSLKAAIDVDLVKATEVIGESSKHWSRWGLDTCKVMPFIPSALAESLSTVSQPRDITLSFSSGTDYMVVPLDELAIPRAVKLGATITSPLCNDFDTSSRDSVMAVFSYIGGPARRAMRDRYGNGKWSQFSQLARIIPPGGVSTVDDKLFSFPWPSERESSVWARDGMVRFEQGEPVLEYREIRANARCVLEAEFMHWQGTLLALDGGSDNAKRRISISGNMAKCIATPFILAQLFDTAVFTPRFGANAAGCGAAIVAFLVKFQHINPRVISLDFSAFVTDTLKGVFGDETPTPSPPITPASRDSGGDHQGAKKRGRSPMSRAGSDLTSDVNEGSADKAVYNGNQSLYICADRTKSCSSIGERPPTPPTPSPQTPTASPPKVFHVPPSPPATPKPVNKISSDIQHAAPRSWSGASTSPLPSHQVMSWMRLLAWPGRDQFPHKMYSAMLAEHLRLSNILRRGYLPQPSTLLGDNDYRV